MDLGENRPGGSAVLEVVGPPEDETAEPVGNYMNRRTEVWACAAAVTRSGFTGISVRNMPSWAASGRSRRCSRN